MNSRRLLRQFAGYTLAVSMLAGCGGAQVELPATPTSTTHATLTPTPTTFATPIPAPTATLAVQVGQQAYTFEAKVTQGSSTRCAYRGCWLNEADALNALLDEVSATYAVDTDRIYLTGLSMGRHGTWYLATKYPERFAAIVPIAGGGDPEKACALKDVPVWAFHGAKDEVVSPEESQEMVNALKACRGDVRFTLYPDAYHDSWTRTYGNTELYEWLLKHTLTESPERQVLLTSLPVPGLA